MAGFVYIMSNPAFPGLLKIGRSRKDPTIDRVNELSLSVGVPQPFKVEYSAFVENNELLETLVLDYFSAYRPNKSRKFFNISCSVAIPAIRDLASQNTPIKYENKYYEPLEIGIKQTLVKEKVQEAKNKEYPQEQKDIGLTSKPAYSDTSLPDYKKEREKSGALLGIAFALLAAVAAAITGVGWLVVVMFLVMVFLSVKEMK